MCAYVEWRLVRTQPRASLQTQRRATQETRSGKDVIVLAIRLFDVYPKLEPPRLLPGDRKRPHRATLDPWSKRKYLVYNLTCPVILAPSHLNQSASAAGPAAVQGLWSTFSSPCSEITFSHISLKNTGCVWVYKRLRYVKIFARWFAVHTGDVRSIAFLQQRLDIAIYIGNLSAAVGTFPFANISVRWYRNSNYYVLAVFKNSFLF